MDPVLDRLGGALHSVLVAHLADTYLVGYEDVADMAKQGAVIAGVGVSIDLPAYEEALEWAIRQGSKLITNINQTTREQIAQAVSDAIEEGAGVDNLSKAIRTEIMDMTRYRSRLIARTETANALQAASLDAGTKLGATHKRWVADSLACPICAANASEGDIPIDQTFSSGDQRPAAHPNCRCALAYSIKGAEAAIPGAELSQKDISISKSSWGEHTDVQIEYTTDEGEKTSSVSFSVDHTKKLSVIGKINVDKRDRKRGIGSSLISLVTKNSPKDYTITTTGVFSDQGRALFNSLVKKGVAIKTEDNFIIMPFSIKSGGH